MTSAPSSAAQTCPPPATGVHDRHRCHPSRHPQKLPLCRKNGLWRRGPTPLGAQMRSSAYKAKGVRLGARPSTCFNGQPQRKMTPCGRELRQGSTRALRGRRTRRPRFPCRPQLPAGRAHRLTIEIVDSPGAAAGAKGPIGSLGPKNRLWQSLLSLPGLRPPPGWTGH
jgi:hypothetical protein